MILVHRHLDIAPGTPVHDLPLDALDDLLDRGDFDDWRALAAAVRRDPYGPLTERVLALCRAHDMYGTARLWPAFIERLRGAPTEGGSPALSLTDLRRQRGKTQAEIATALGISQSDVSKLERRADLRVSTLRRYVRAVGGDLELVACFQGGDMRVQMAPASRRAVISSQE